MDQQEDRDYTPAQTTVNWLASLPLPPNAVSTTPTSKQDWQLVECYRILVEAITLLGEWERERLASQARAWDERTANLSSLTKSLHIEESSALTTLSNVHAALPIPLPPAQSTSSAAIAQDPLPSIYSAVQQLEDRIVHLGLEVNEAHSRLKSLEVEHTKKEETLKIGNGDDHMVDDKVAIQRALKSSALLDQKTQEYRLRLASLQKQVDEQAAAVSSMSSLLQREVKAQASALSLSGLSIHSTEYAELKERRNKLKGKLAAFGDLPTDLGLARNKVEEKKQRVGRSR